MSWHLSKIILYSKRNGSATVVPFNSHGLSIVTGGPKRGKSSLLDIVDYCLLSGSCQISKGRIREAVEKVGVVLENPRERMVIVRGIPPSGQLNVTTVGLLRGDVDVPTRAPDDRWSLDAAKEELSDFTGIEAVPVIEQSDGRSRRILPTSIRHCSAYLRQPQDVIASRNVSFPGLSDESKRRHTAEAASYFLGAIDSETMAMRSELVDAKRRIATLERQRREFESARLLSLERARILWAEAVALGMLPPGPPPESVDASLAVLANAGAFEVRSTAAATALTDYDLVVREEAYLRSRLRTKEAELSELRRFQEASRDSVRTSDSQVSLLRINELFPDFSDSACPVCGAHDGAVAEARESLSSALVDLRGTAHTPHRLVGQIDALVVTLSAEIADLRARLGDCQRKLDVVLRQRKAQQDLVAEMRRRLEVTGRAKELESVLRQLSRRPTDDLDVLKKRAQELDALVGDQALRRRRHDAEEKLQTTLLANARQLSVEFPEHEFRINFDSMRFELNFNSRWVGLDEIGSGSNWLAYHVAGATGLQQYFAQHSRPVPRLLMLDQPSQAWFPQEPATGSAGYKDEDLEAVRKLYWFLHNASQGSRAPQIIIVDHARLAQKWFQQAVIRDWHGAEGLVPSDW